MNAANDDFEGPIGAIAEPVAGVRGVTAEVWDGLNALHLPFAVGLMLAMWAIIELERWLQ